MKAPPDILFAEVDTILSGGQDIGPEASEALRAAIGRLATAAAAFGYEQGRERSDEEKRALESHRALVAGAIKGTEKRQETAERWKEWAAPLIEWVTVHDRPKRTADVLRGVKGLWDIDDFDFGIQDRNRTNAPDLPGDCNRCAAPTFLG